MDLFLQQIPPNLFISKFLVKEPIQWAFISVGGDVDNERLKVCSQCKKEKNLFTDFYLCQGKWRGECKRCTIAKNAKYQKRMQSWRNREIDSSAMRAYQLDYYAQNKAKFAEYRQKFKEKHPEYHKLYARRKKNEKR